MLQTINSKLEKINEQLTLYNETTNHLHDSLSSSSMAKETRINFLRLQLESELFDVSLLHHACQMTLREKLNLLLRIESDAFTLQTDIDLLSLLLKNAQELLSQRDSLMNVQEYLNQCKVQSRVL